MIRNREAANVQITAEQLVYDARTQFAGNDDLLPSQKDEQWKIMDKDELNQFLQRKRKDYEDRIRKNRKLIRAYLDYARFEATQEDYRRCRSILERAITVLSHDATLWLAYAEIEAKGKFINHALNVLDRAVTLLPRMDSLWFKYVLYQESVGNIQATREVFERWMKWTPPNHDPWFAYCAFEERAGDLPRARDVFERFCGHHPIAKAYIKFAKWEERHGFFENARFVLSRAVGEGGDDEKPELPTQELEEPDIWLSFAQFEVRRNEIERARALFEFALTQVKVNKARLFAAFSSFEKRLSENSEEVVVMRRRNDYEEMLVVNTRDYDAWLDLCKLEESQGSSNVERIRQTYSQAQAQIPLEPEKRFWRRYIYLFIFEALFEELTMKDFTRAQATLKRALDLIPHRKFTFSKIWILAAQLELRLLNLQGARKLLGTSIGMCPKDKTFRQYIQLELQLGQVARCRILYEKYLVWAPTNSRAWAKYAEMEHNVGETNRARALFELGVNQPLLDEPEKLWMRYIEFEEDDAQAKLLFHRLIERTHGTQAKVWIAFAKFVEEKEESRQILNQAEERCRTVPDERAKICFARAEMEPDWEEAKLRLPQRTDEGWLFPRDVEEKRLQDASNQETVKANAALKLMEMAQRHKKLKMQQEQQQQSSE